MDLGHLRRRRHVLDPRERPPLPLGEPDAGGGRDRGRRPRLRADGAVVVHLPGPRLLPAARLRRDRPHGGAAGRRHGGRPLLQGPEELTACRSTSTTPRTGAPTPTAPPT